MNPVEGRNSKLQMFIGDSWEDILCATDMNVSYKPEFITKTGPNSSNAREFARRMYEWSMSVSGLTLIANDTVISYFYLMQEGVRASELQIRAYYIDSDGNEKVMSGNAFVGATDFTGPSTDFCNATINFQGTGDLDISNPITPVVVTYNYLSDWWVTVAGNTFVNVGSVASGVHGYTLTAADVVLEIDREGIQHDEVTGTPGNRQGKFNTSNLHVEYDSTNPFTTGEKIFIEFKRPV